MYPFIMLYISILFAVKCGTLFDFRFDQCYNYFVKYAIPGDARRGYYGYTIA